MELKTKKRIGIDLDDTVWKLHEGFLTYCNEKFNKNFTLKDCVEYNIVEKLYEIEVEDVKILLDEFELLEKYQHLPFLQEFSELILKLDEVYEIYFITARSSKDDNLVQNRLYKIFERKMPVLYQYDENRNKINEKINFCLDNNIEIMIDDRHSNLIECSNNGLKCFLINYPWNKDEALLENMIRVNNWKEIVEELLK